MGAASFQDLGNSPATFDASRWADCYGCYLETMCRWLTPCRHTSKQNSQEYIVGLNSLMKRGVHPQVDTNSVDRSADF